MAKVRRELRHVRQMAALAGCPGIRDLGDGVDEGFVIGEDAENASLEHVPEVANGGDTGEKLPVEG